MMHLMIYDRNQGAANNTKKIYMKKLREPEDLKNKVEEIYYSVKQFMKVGNVYHLQEECPIEHILSFVYIDVKIEDAEYTEPTSLVLKTEYGDRRIRSNCNIYCPQTNKKIYLDMVNAWTVIDEEQYGDTFCT
jgi:hypothetical protein